LAGRENWCWGRGPAAVGSWPGCGRLVAGLRSARGPAAVGSPVPGCSRSTFLARWGRGAAWNGRGLWSWAAESAVGLVGWWAVGLVGVW